MSINVFLTGLPGVGKTTIIQKFMRKCPVSVWGFFTREIREHGRRMGFTIEAICSWDGNESAEHIHAVMAHVSIQGRDDVTVIQVTPDNRKALSERLFDIFGVET